MQIFLLNGNIEIGIEQPLNAQVALIDLVQFTSTRARIILINNSKRVIINNFFHDSSTYVPTLNILLNFSFTMDIAILFDKSIEESIPLGVLVITKNKRLFNPTMI